jgi:hypothetical protein
MPIKITYDLNNSAQCELINDYYFFKYYLKSILFDWSDYYYNGGNYKQILKHLNKHEYKRFNDLYNKLLSYYYNFVFELEDEKIIQDMFMWNKQSLYMYKKFLKIELN